MIFHRETTQRKTIVAKKSELISRELRRVQEAIPFHRPKFSRDVATVLSFVRENLFDPELNVDRLRIVCQLRNHNISTRFKGELGVGIRQYIEEQRIGAARRLLEHSELEVWLVATSVGFSSAESFCRSFRRRVGTSPSEYRARATKQEKTTSREAAGAPTATQTPAQEAAGPSQSPASERRSVSSKLRDGTGDTPAQKPDLPPLSGISLSEARSKADGTKQA